MLHELRDDGYELSSERERIDLPRVHRWISTDAYWALGRPLEQMRAALAGSQPYGIYERGGGQVAIARVVTDGAVFAYLCDVYVDPAHRGRGLGGWLVKHLRDHYASLGLTRFVLVTKDAHAVYARHGFTDVEPGRWMQCDLRAPVGEQRGVRS
ncbi:GNAT family N-acetyltransferase [Paractinoplanes hotanensis]|uniref:GNAT family N-acetyltransferase n=1 Tax=Paractinoplanes hotanensis TaxID=2906497 RepID=A0ABT0XZZ1_9ACTN|nr:GNAT family N-acetyltransferase [Actinoplanes hotanensis]MCM4079358.1 GNAT family N-acetyltransferase [Actinoplanes hotanensis]